MTVYVKISCQVEVSFQIPSPKAFLLLAAGLNWYHGVINLMTSLEKCGISHHLASLLLCNLYIQTSQINCFIAIIMF